MRKNKKKRKLDGEKVPPALEKAIDDFSRSLTALEEAVAELQAGARKECRGRHRAPERSRPKAK